MQIKTSEIINEIQNLKNIIDKYENIKNNIFNSSPVNTTSKLSTYIL